MADGVKITVLKDSLIRKFRALVPAADQEIEAAAMRSAEDVAALARRFTRSSRVRNSIHVEPVPERLAALVVAGDDSTLVEIRKDSGKKRGLQILEEFGTKPHIVGGKFKGAQHPGTKANPFMFAASHLTKKSNTRRMGAAVGKAARKVAGS